MNCKGVEGLPFSFLVSLIVLGVVLSAGFVLIDSLSSFNSKSSFFNGLLGLRERIDFLKTGDPGSFSRFDLVVPTGYSVIFSGASISFVNGSVKNNLGVRAVFIEPLTLGSGGYDLLLCYSYCDSSDVWKIVFE